MDTHCYVTKQTAIIPYTLGSRICLPLTQESYAHFIIRSGKHLGAQQINTELTVLNKKVRDVENKHLFCAKTSPDFLDNLPTDTYLDLSVELSITADRAQALSTQLVETSILILKGMRDEFQKTGRLTS